MGVLLVTGILKEITCLQAVADDEAVNMVTSRG